MPKLHTARETISIVDGELCWHFRTDGSVATLKCVDVLTEDHSVPAREAPPIPTDVHREARDEGYTVKR